MRDEHKRAFAELMQATADYYRQPAPSASTVSMYWRGLSDLEFDVVRRSFEAHMNDPQVGAYMPKLNDVRRVLQSAQESDGHPGPDEAWAIAVQAKDEAETVVWTQQIASAFHEAAMPLIRERDSTGARFAFRERYSRLPGQARARGEAPRWFPSLGTDPMRREGVLLEAADRGLLGHNHVESLTGVTPPEEARKLLAKIKARLLANG